MGRFLRKMMRGRSGRGMLAVRARCLFEKKGLFLRLGELSSQQ
jgi:hypothetical protein